MGAIAPSVGASKSHARPVGPPQIEPVMRLHASRRIQHEPSGHASAFACRSGGVDSLAPASCAGKSALWLVPAALGLFVRALTATLLFHAFQGIAAMRPWSISIFGCAWLAASLCGLNLYPIVTYLFELGFRPLSSSLPPKCLGNHRSVFLQLALAGPLANNVW